MLRIIGAFFIALFSSSCSPSINFDIKGTQSEFFQNANENFKAVINSDCFKNKLNNYPAEVAKMRNAHLHTDVYLTQDELPNFALADNDGESIRVFINWVGSKKRALNTLVHETAHLLGFKHPGVNDPKYGSVEHAGSFPSQAGNVAEQCAEEMGL